MQHHASCHSSPVPASAVSLLRQASRGSPFITISVPLKHLAGHSTTAKCREEGEREQAEWEGFQHESAGAGWEGGRINACLSARRARWLCDKGLGLWPCGEGHMRPDLC
jgi:hypothetical protein